MDVPVRGRTTHPAMGRAVAPNRLGNGDVAILIGDCATACATLIAVTIAPHCRLPGSRHQCAGARRLLDSARAGRAGRNCRVREVRRPRPRRASGPQSPNRVARHAYGLDGTVVRDREGAAGRARHGMGKTTVRRVAFMSRGFLHHIHASPPTSPKLPNVGDTRPHVGHVSFGLHPSHRARVGVVSRIPPSWREFAMIRADTGRGGPTS